jgi:signal transduction histidine kinase
MTTRRLSDTDSLRDNAGVKAVRALCHDLRQPLSAILMLAESGVGDPERRLATIRDEARWLASMIDDVLTDAPVDHPDVVDVLALVQGCVDRARPTAGCSLTVTGRPGAEAFVPPVVLGRAVGCILDNAVRAAGAGGHVSIDVHPQAGSIHVVIEDDGPGLGKVPAHTSMGLTITAALVTSSGGQFTLTPRSGAPHGAVARIVLPGLGARAVAS